MTEAKRAVFFDYIGDQTCSFAFLLLDKGYEISVVNCENTHSCFQVRGVKHSFHTDKNNAAVLSTLYHDSLAKKFACTVIVAECDSSLSTAGFETNLQLRYARKQISSISLSISNLSILLDV